MTDKEKVEAILKILGIEISKEFLDREASVGLILLDIEHALDEWRSA